MQLKIELIDFNDIPENTVDESQDAVYYKYTFDNGLIFYRTSGGEYDNDMNNRMDTIWVLWSLLYDYYYSGPEHKTHAYVEANKSLIEEILKAHIPEETWNWYLNFVNAIQSKQYFASQYYASGLAERINRHISMVKGEPVDKLAEEPKKSFLSRFCAREVFLFIFVQSLIVMGSYVLAK